MVLDRVSEVMEGGLAQICKHESFEVILLYTRHITIFLFIISPRINVWYIARAQGAFHPANACIPYASLMSIISLIIVKICKLLY